MVGNDQPRRRGAIIVAFPNGKYSLDDCRSIIKDGNWIKNQRNSSNFDIMNIFAPAKPDLNGNDPISFSKAAIYNIQNKNWNKYKSISDRNSWYVWADKVARKKNNFWFSAADYVTRWNAVGAADLDLNLGLVTDEEEFVLRAINEQLLKQNFTNFGEYLINTNGKIKDGFGNDVLLTGQALDEKMVEIEQLEVENYISIAKSKFEIKFGNGIEYCVLLGITKSYARTKWDCAIAGINCVSNNSCLAGQSSRIFKSRPYTEAYKKYELKYPTTSYDFLKINHRILLGKEMAKYIRENGANN